MNNKLIFILIVFLITSFIIKYKNSNYENFKDNATSVDLNNLRDFYGLEYLKKLKESGYKLYNAKDYIDKKVDYDKNSYKTILIGDGSVDSNNMIDVYKHCYLGLRLTPHDGVGYQVIESGLMGIKTVHNGGAPSSICYSNVEDIKKIIEKEKEKIGTVDDDLSNKTYDFCKFNKKTFKLSTYFNDVNPNLNFEQIHVSKSIIFFRDKFIKKNKEFKLYHNTNKPAIFFGVYSLGDLKLILRHKSHALIVFGGSDTYLKNKRIKFTLKKLSKLDNKKFAFIAQSKYIEDDLKLFKIKFHKNPFYFGFSHKIPSVKGNSIYMYIRKKK